MTPWPAVGCQRASGRPCYAVHSVQLCMIVNITQPGCPRLSLILKATQLAASVTGNGCHTAARHLACCPPSLLQKPCMPGVPTTGRAQHTLHACHNLCTTNLATPPPNKRCRQFSWPSPLPGRQPCSHSLQLPAPSRLTATAWASCRGMYTVQPSAMPLYFSDADRSAL